MASSWVRLRRLSATRFLVRSLPARPSAFRPGVLDLSPSADLGPGTPCAPTVSDVPFPWFGVRFCSGDGCFARFRSTDHVQNDFFQFFVVCETALPHEFLHQLRGGRGFMQTVDRGSRQADDAHDPLDRARLLRQQVVSRNYRVLAEHQAIAGQERVVRRVDATAWRRPPSRR